MKPRQFAKYLARDLNCPCGCVGREDTFIPQHRINRGLGGSKSLNVPSNIIVMCSEMNGRIESDALMARLARVRGWKLARWQNPAEVPFLDAHDGQWHLIDNNFNRVTTKEAA